MLFPSITLAVPAKSVRNPVEQVTNLLVVDRAQGRSRPGIQTSHAPCQFCKIWIGCAWMMDERTFARQEKRMKLAI